MSNHLAQNLGILTGQILRFTYILGKIIESPGTIFTNPNRFPLFHPDCGLTSIFPIQKIVLLLLVPSNVLTNQFCQNGHSIKIPGSFCISQLCQCRKDINLTEQQITHGIRLYFSRPTHQIGNSQSTLIQVSFAAAKFNTSSRIQVGAEIASWMFIAPESILPAIVTREENNGVVFQLKVTEQIKNGFQIIINHRHHRRIVFNILRNFRIVEPCIIYIRIKRWIIRWNVIHAMGRSDRKIAEERTIFIFANKIQTAFHDFVV